MSLSLTSFPRSHAAFVNRQAQRWRQQKVLDVGCGSGYLTSLFGRQNQTTGIDLNNNVQSPYRNFTFNAADATSLPFPGQAFDLVISFDVIEHVKDDLAMLREAHRVLQPGGYLLLGTPNRARLSNRLKSFLGRPVKYPLDLGSDPAVGPCIHLREYTVDSLSEVAQEAGFQTITINPFWFGLTILPVGLMPPPKSLAPACQYYFLTARAAAPAKT